MLSEMNAPASFHAIALVPDLMVSVRLESAVRRDGGRLTTLHYERDFFDALGKGPQLAIVDLGMDGLDVIGLAEACKKAKVPLVAFGPHVDAKGLRAARAAGIPYVYTRSQFMADVAGLLRAAITATEPATTNG